MRLSFDLFSYSRLIQDTCCSADGDPYTFIITEIDGIRLAMCQCGRTWKLKEKIRLYTTWKERWGRHVDRADRFDGLGTFLFEIDMDKFLLEEEA